VKRYYAKITIHHSVFSCARVHRSKNCATE